MKKIIAIMLCAALGSCVFLTGCGGSKSSANPEPSSTQESSSDMTTQILYTLTYSVPGDWEKQSSTDQSANQYEPPVGGMLMVSMDGSLDFPDDTDVWAKSFFDKVEEGGNTRVGDLTKGSMGEAVTYEAPVTRTDPNATFKGYTKIVLSGHAQYWGIVVVPESSFNSYDATMKEILSSMTLSATSAPAGAEDKGSSADASSSSEAQPKATVSQQNALKQAHNYLDFTAFSYSGLIEQLEFEKYSTEDATYAADNCGADWNEQASKKAASYMEFTAFSRGGLIDQLIFEGFTEEQAAYGADSVGL